MECLCCANTRQTASRNDGRRRQRVSEARARGSLNCRPVAPHTRASPWRRGFAFPPDAAETGKFRRRVPSASWIRRPWTTLTIDAGSFGSAAICCSKPSIPVKIPGAVQEANNSSWVIAASLCVMRPGRLSTWSANFSTRRLHDVARFPFTRSAGVRPVGLLPLSVRTKRLMRRTSLWKTRLVPTMFHSHIQPARASHKRGH